MRTPIRSIFAAVLLPSLGIAAEPAETTPKPAPTRADVLYGQHPRNVLDFYQAPSDKPTPVVIYMHGGAWSNGDKKDIAKSGGRDLPGDCNSQARLTHPCSPLGLAIYLTFEKPLPLILRR